MLHLQENHTNQAALFIVKVTIALLLALVLMFGIMMSTDPGAADAAGVAQNYSRLIATL